MKMKRMTCTVYNFLECSLRTTQHVTVFSKFRLSTRPEEEEEVAEYKATFLDVLKRLKAARKCMCQFDTENNIILMCNKCSIQTESLSKKDSY
jgi:hypothetical protein